MDKLSFDYNPSALSDGLIGAGIQMMLGSTNQRMPVGLLGSLANGMAGFGQGLKDHRAMDFEQKKLELENQKYQAMIQHYQALNDYYKNGGASGKTDPHVFGNKILWRDGKPVLANIMSNGTITDALASTGMSAQPAGIPEGMFWNPDTMSVQNIPGVTSSKYTLESAGARGRNDAGIITVDRQNNDGSITKGVVVRSGDAANGSIPTGVDLKTQKDIETNSQPLTDSQGNAVIFGSRAQAAHDLLNSLDGQYNPASIAAAKSMDGVPGINWAANAALSPESQKAMQAQLDFINAVLRKESGAAISPSEFANGAKQYFPQPGDSPEVIRQKAENREREIAGLKISAGPAAEKHFKPAAPAPKQSKPMARPQPGDVIGNHRYKGGNPNDPNSWEQI